MLKIQLAVWGALLTIDQGPSSFSKMLFSFVTFNIRLHSDFERSETKVHLCLSFRLAWQAPQHFYAPHETLWKRLPTPAHSHTGRHASFLSKIASGPSCWSLPESKCPLTFPEEPGSIRTANRAIIQRSLGCSWSLMWNYCTLWLSRLLQWKEVSR